MDWDDLRIVLAISRAGTLTAAARTLKLDPTTVGRRLKAFEDHLEVALFLRSKSALQPTEAGEAVVAHAERMESEALALADAVESYSGSPRGLVRIATMPWIVNHLIVPALPAFCARYPEIEIEAIGGVRERSTSKRETDISLRFELLPRGGEDCFRVAVFGYALYCPASQSQQSLPWVAFGEDFTEYLPFKWLEKEGEGNKRIRLRINDAGAAYLAIRAGVGKGLIPEILGEADPTLVRLSGPEPEFIRELRVLVRADLRHIARIATVIDWLKEILPR